jgi:hypothetical protein
MVANMAGKRSRMIDVIESRIHIVTNVITRKEEITTTWKIGHDE